MSSDGGDGEMSEQKSDEVQVVHCESAGGERVVVWHCGLRLTVRSFDEQSR